MILDNIFYGLFYTIGDFIQSVYVFFMAFIIFWGLYDLILKR
jgi:hypothetical protein